MSIFKKKKKVFNFEEAFKANLKYISQTELNPKIIEKQFVKTNTRNYITIGQIDVPTGHIIVSDPLAYLPTGKYAPTLEQIITPGKYKVEISLINNKYIGLRICTLKLKIKNTKAKKYICATPTEETAAFIAKDGPMTGFPVDAGMISICDAKVAKEYQEFMNNWYQKNPHGNHYDDYFATLLKESYKKYPEYQREDGDFLEWTNPITNNRLIMTASGLGDGFYQSFFGIDEYKEICELIIPLINPELFEEE